MDIDTYKTRGTSYGAVSFRPRTAGADQNIEGGGGVNYNSALTAGVRPYFHVFVDEGGGGYSPSIRASTVFSPIHPYPFSR